MWVYKSCVYVGANGCKQSYKMDKICIQAPNFNYKLKKIKTIVFIKSFLKYKNFSKSLSINTY